jgi:hypothetical protein
MSDPRDRIMDDEERAVAFELARRTLGRHLAGPWPPPEDSGDLILALARVTYRLCRHIEAVEEINAVRSG